MSTVKTVYLATHDLADDVQGLGSWLALDSSSRDNGLLTAKRISNLQLNKAQALRKAMLATMKQNPNPRNWAAFTIIGEAL